MRTSSSQCHNNPVLVPPRKPPDPMKYIYDGQNYDLKTTVDIWTRMARKTAGQREVALVGTHPKSP